MHGLMMCATFLVMLPVGVVVLRVLEKVVWHAVIQGVGMVVAGVGVGVGVWLGRRYNHVSCPISFLLSFYFFQIWFLGRFVYAFLLACLLAGWLKLIQRKSPDPQPPPTNS